MGTGGIFSYGSVIMHNSILAGNSTNLWYLSPDCAGSITSRGYNLIQSTTGCVIEGDPTGNLLGVEPQLSPLQDHGGPTLTHALLAGSPAIDAGNPLAPGSGETACETSDQRGAVRPQDGNNDRIARCDIGAFEVGSLQRVVRIDIKPGSAANPINLKSRGLIPVAILTTQDVDASQIDPHSVTFGPNGAGEAHGKGHLEDIDRDGDNDLVLHFRTQETGIRCGATVASLSGMTASGQSVSGTDTITTVGC